MLLRLGRFQFRHYKFRWIHAFSSWSFNIKFRLKPTESSHQNASSKTTKTSEHSHSWNSSYDKDACYQRNTKKQKAKKWMNRHRNTTQPITKTNKRSPSWNSSYNQAACYHRNTKRQKSKNGMINIIQPNQLQVQILYIFDIKKKNHCYATADLRFWLIIN